MNYLDFQIAKENYNNRFSPIDRGNDPKMIKDIIQKNYNVDLTEKECEFLWLWYSEEYFFASWLDSINEEFVNEAFESFIKNYNYNFDVNK